MAGKGASSISPFVRQSGRPSARRLGGFIISLAQL
jgi:hypothetical protein